MLKGEEEGDRERKKERKKEREKERLTEIKKNFEREEEIKGVKRIK
jgi:hypothetical protein